jgi:outer membrane protein OmpA-like peptidoglycan-associated protein
MKQATNTVFIGILMCLSVTIFAQQPKFPATANNGTIANNDIFALDSLGVASTKSLRRESADKIYRCYGFATSTPIYEKLEETGESDRAMQMHLANNYRLNGNTEKAEYWYAKFVQPTDPAKILLQYAQLLQANGKCAEAVKWYTYFITTASDTEKLGRSYLTDCKVLDEMPVRKEVILTNLNFINTADMEMAAVPYENGVMFTSNRPRTGYSITKDRWTQTNFMDLYYAKKDTKTGTYAAPKALEGKINGKFHDGTAALHPAGNIMYFSRNSDLGGDNGYLDLKIYAAENKNNYWTNIQSLPFNSDDFSNCHPTISSDGKTMYFASNRKGGYGGMDIYVVRMSSDGKWGFPINLGSTVNSAGNELFPYIALGGTLFFSSDGHLGFGGLDIFAACNTDEDDRKGWTLCENIGKPFNSTKDDFGFSIDNEYKHGFVTSNRNGGFGNDDIYEWNSHTKIDFNTLQAFLVIDSRNKNNVLREATVHLADSDSDIESKTNEKGIAKHKVSVDRTYKIKVEQAGYMTYDTIMKGADLVKLNAVVIPLKKIEMIKWTGIVNEANAPTKLIANANVQIINRSTKQVMQGKTSSQGFIQFDIPCNETFDIVVTPNETDLEQYATNFFTSDNFCAQSAMTATLPLNTKVIANKVPDAILTSKTVEGLDKTNIANNAIIELKEMYYNYDRTEILQESANELDRVVSILLQYPLMTMELRSHTDSRGKDQYNMALSQRRAESAVQYIISKGIDRGRIIARGYGETEIRNECANGVTCTDEQHRFNRRTEIKITSMGGATNVRDSSRNR